MQANLILGGSTGIGRELALHLARKGEMVTISSRSIDQARSAAAELNAALDGPPLVTGIAVDLAKPHTVKESLAGVANIKHLVIPAVGRDRNTVLDYDIDRAVDLATLKVVGYTAAASCLRDRIAAGGSILLFGGVAKDQPYPGSTTVTAVNAAVVGIVNTLKRELSPTRVNSIHPGLVGDSPYWVDQPGVANFALQHTLSGKLATMADIVDGALFLMNNPAANGIDLIMNGGWA